MSSSKYNQTQVFSLLVLSSSSNEVNSSDEVKGVFSYLHLRNCSLCKRGHHFFLLLKRKDLLKEFERGKRCCVFERHVGEVTA